MVKAPDEAADERGPSLKTGEDIASAVLERSREAAHTRANVFGEQTLGGLLQTSSNFPSALSGAPPEPLQIIARASMTGRGPDERRCGFTRLAAASPRAPARCDRSGCERAGRGSS